ncbi:MAG: hypothetical protein ACRDOI_36930 [Trebonia sp.]
MARLPLRSAGPAKGEHPDRPFTGYKLAHAVLSADGARTGFAGLTLGATSVYGVISDACCVWNHRHAPPRRWCGCGFYCLHALADARAMACATENRAALLLEVAASGRYIRYERGLRYSRQRVRAILDAQCACGRPSAALADAGSGLIGWRHLAPVCDTCTRGRPSLTLKDFAARLDGTVAVATRPLGTSFTPEVSGARDGSAAAAESPIAILTAEIALLHARLDDLQTRLDK